MIQGQRTKLARSVHNIRYDPVHDEIIAASPVAQSILIFRGGADGNEPPLRTIQGPRTQLWDPDFVGVDGTHNEIYVTSGERVLVFSQQANGDVAPLRILEGPDTRLGRMRGAPQVVPGGELMVVSSGPIPGKPQPSNQALLIFNRTANGNVKPLRAIEGVGSDDFVVSPKGWILIGGSANEGGRGGGEGGEPNGRIRIWSVNDNGTVPPRWIVGGPRTKMNGDNLALNPNAKEVIVHKGDQNGIAGYSLPEIF